MTDPGPQPSAKRTLRDLAGVICPVCRHHVTEALGEGRLRRCPHHPEHALVTTKALAAADGDPFLGVTLGERFVVLERLGAGSMGTVYRARQEAVGRDVAVKIVRSERLVDAQAKSRFQQEAHATSMLTSPHTVTVFDFGEVRVRGSDPQMVDGSLFLAMELLDGESLGERLKRGAVPVAEAVTIVRHALASLVEAHDKGVVHRDLKPDNLLLTRDPAGEPITKVLDFGIAKLVDYQGMDALETQAGTVFGTPRYMSPEQAQGKALDARSDIYSLGVILYHMLLGRPPFTDGDAVVVMAHHIKTVPERPSDVDTGPALPGGLEELLMRVLAKSPERRPQTAQAFAAELDGLGPLESVQASAELTAVVHTSVAPPRSRRIMLAGAAVAAGLGVVAAAAITSGGDGRRMVASEGMAAAAAATALRVLADGPEVTSRGASPNKQESEAADDPDVPAAEVAPRETGPSRPALPVPAPRPRSRGYERFD